MKNYLIKFHLLLIKTFLFYICLSSSITFLLLFWKKEMLFFFVTKPLLLIGKSFVFTSLSGSFFFFFKLIFFFMVLFEFLLICYLGWLFISPSLYNYQKVNYFLVILVFILIFSIIISWYYFYLLYFIIQFCLFFEISNTFMEIIFAGRIEDFLVFLKNFFKSSFLFFFIPIIIIGIQQINKLFKLPLFFYKFFSYGIFMFLFFLIVPPDFNIQIILIVPFIIFFECFILFLHLKDWFIKYNIEESRIRTCDE